MHTFEKSTAKSQNGYYEEQVSYIVNEINMESSPEPDTMREPDSTKILTDEIFMDIFSFLDMRSLCLASQVCRRWDSLSKDRSLWKNVDLSPITYALEEYDFLTLIKSKLKCTHKLNIGTLKMTTKMLRRISLYCTELKTLIFGRNSTLDQQHSKRKSKLYLPKSIETLDMRHAYGDFSILSETNRTYYHICNVGIAPRTFDEFKLSLLFAKLPNLSVIDLTNCLEVDDDVLRTLARTCPNIESLCLIGCRNVRGYAFETLIKYCWNLKTLLLRYLKIEDEVISQLIWKDCVIKELDISACPRITWQGLFNFLVQLKHVEYLNMSYCGDGHAVTDTVLYEMANRGTANNLRMLDMRWSFHVTKNALTTFISKCKRLSNLGLYQSIKVTADDIATLLSQLPNIEILEYGGSFPQELNRSKIIPNLMTYVQRIEVLSLINFTSLSLKEDYKHLKALMKKSKNLKRVNFCDCAPELVKIGRDAAKCAPHIKITVKWECALPAPNLTLDSIVM